MLNEGLLKVNKELLSGVIDTYKKIIVTRSYKYFIESLDGQEIDDDIRELYDSDFDFFEKTKKYIDETIPIKPSDKEFHFKLKISPNMINVSGYPQTKETLIGAFIVSFENKDFGAFYTEDTTEPYDFAIGLDCTTHIKNIGKNSNGVDVFSIQYNIIAKELSRVEEVIGHELMHLMQHKVIRSHRIDNLDYDHNNIDYEKYLTSDVEFNPYIYSELKLFINKLKGRNITSYKDIMSEFKLFVGVEYNILKTSSFFNMLRLKDKKRYKKAIRIFFNELITEIEKGLN